MNADDDRQVAQRLQRKEYSIIEHSFAEILAG